jgi:cell division protein FtsQ
MEILTPDIRNALTRLGWLLLLLFTGAMVISAVEKRSVATLKDLRVHVQPLDDDEHYLIKDKDVKRLIAKNFQSELVGEAVERVELEALERMLEQEPFVLDADVYLDATNTVQVEIQQRRPLLRVMDSNGLNYYLDENGVKMPISHHYTARVLVATGSVPPYVPGYLDQKQSVMKDLFVLTNYMLQDEFLQPLVEQVHVVQGEFVLIPKIGDQKIVLGNLTNLDDKVERLKIFYREGLPREGWQSFDKIDLRFKGQVICGRR